MVILNPATGSWAYRPTAAARHRAVADHARADDRCDSFTITVTDRRGGTTVVPVMAPLVSMKTVPSYAVTAQIPVGVAPVDLALSPGGDHVYVTNVVDDAAVTVIRTADNATSTIPLDFSPQGVVVGSSGGHLYVTDPVGNRVAVIDTSDHSTVFIAVGERPFCMAFLGTDLYVANNQDGTVSMIDTVHNDVIRTIAVDGHPYAVAACGGRVYVTDYGFYGGQSTHSISVIDAAGGHVIDEIPVGYYPTGIAVSPEGSRVYVTNDEGSYTRTHPGTTTVIDTATLEVIDTLPVGGVSIAVDDDGSHAYVISRTYTEQFTSALAIVDVATSHVERVCVNGMPNALATNGDRIYLTDTWHSSVQQLTARQTSVVDTDAVNDPPTLAISQTDDYVYQATVVDPDNDTVTYTATQPFSGTVTDLGRGRFQYTPNSRADEGFVDHFAITADDGHGGIVTKTVSATVY
jgi:YVTN family beta-propeller protein